MQPNFVVEDTKHAAPRQRMVDTFTESALYARDLLLEDPSRVIQITDRRSGMLFRVTAEIA